MTNAEAKAIEHILEPAIKTCKNIRIFLQTMTDMDTRDIDDIEVAISAVLRMAYSELE